MGVGLHPDAEYFDVQLVASERYARVERQMRGLIKRTPECALHVHVGVPDTQSAVNAMNGLREALPLLHGLSATTVLVRPGLPAASARAAMIRAYPGRGIPPFLRSWDDYLEALDAVRGEGPPTRRWCGGRRPQPRLGTVELRELDVQADLASTAAIAGFAHAIAGRAAEAPPREPAHERCIGRASSPRATAWMQRSSMKGGRLCCARSRGPHSSRPAASGEDRFTGVERILAEVGALRQRAAHERGGMPGLIRHLRDETAEGRNRIRAASYAASRSAATVSSCARRAGHGPRAGEPARSERPRRRPVSRSACGCSRSSPKRSVMMSRSTSRSTVAQALVPDAGYNPLLLDRRAVARDQVAEGGLAVLADALVEAGRSAIGTADVRHLVDRQVHDPEISSSVGWRPSWTASLRSASWILRVRATMWTGRRTVRPELARPRLIAWRIQSAPYVENLKPGAVELLDRANQPEHALLDQVRERQALALVLACDGDHEPQVRVDHALLRREVAALDALGELDLVRAGEQRVTTRLVEEELEGVLEPLPGRRVGSPALPPDGSACQWSSLLLRLIVRSSPKIIHNRRSRVTPRPKACSYPAKCRFEPGCHCPLTSARRPSLAFLGIGGVAYG